MPSSPSLRSRYRGCLLGGAVGDALGAPVEFLTLDEIRARYGEEGIGDLDKAFGRVGAITDDTQMTLFTAEGLLRAAVRQREKGICYPPGVVHHAYLRWLHTQGLASEHTMYEYLREKLDGWLIRERRLFEQRAPGRTCLRALMGDEIGTPDEPLNDSKGCGGVMRAAPVGLLVTPGLAFEFGCDVAAITHGHPSGYYAAGALGVIVSVLVAGESLAAALTEAGRALADHEGAEECRRALGHAEEFLSDGLVSATAEGVERLGQGWVAEEALAIAVYCAAGAVQAGIGSSKATFEHGVQLAVNHSGDSDSTGAICGNMLGALLGEEAIPQRWREGVELADVVLQVADDLYEEAHGEGVPWARYPGW
jgi:ADP-ribosylglycohydrolase